MSGSEISNFNQFVRELEDGQFDVDASEQLQKAVEALNNAVLQDGVRKAKATISCSFELLIDSGNISITGSVTSKLPVKPRGRSIFWSTAKNFLSRENPRQPSLPFSVTNGGRAEIVNLDAKEN